jgi:hypothetical protein
MLYKQIESSRFLFHQTSHFFRNICNKYSYQYSYILRESICLLALALIAVAARAALPSVVALLAA